MKGKTIKQLRHALGISQQDMADRLAVSPITVSRWENNHAKPSPLALKQLAELFQGVNNGRKSKSNAR